MANSVAKDILHEQLKATHDVLVQTMDGVTNEVAAFAPPGKANPIAGTFAHLVMSEDFFVHQLLQKKTPIFDSTFKDKTGADSVQPSEWVNEYPKWLRSVKVDMAQLMKYTKAVFENTEKYVASLSDEDLMKKIDMSAFGMPERTAGYIISGMILVHAGSIMGEVSVLKGIQGLKGYPF